MTSERRCALWATRASPGLASVGSNRCPPHAPPLLLRPANIARARRQSRAAARRAAARFTRTDSIVERDPLSVGVLVGGGDARLAAEIGPAGMEYTVGAHRHGGIVADEHSLQDLACHRAHGHELN